MRQAEKYRNIAANYDHMALAINDQELRWMYLDFAQHGAKWRSKPKLKMIWIVRSSADGGAAPSRRSAGAAGAGVPFVTFEANRPRLP